jgi:hypothetical protein
MTRLRFLAVALLTVLGVTQTATSEPAFASNCLSCHGVLQSNVLGIVGYNTTADPDESATGAPDRGTLKVFRAYRGTARPLKSTIQNLVPDDTYAVTLKRLRYNGVVSGGHLTYSADCDWPEWGDAASYYSQPDRAYTWGVGPTQFSYALEIGPDAAYDYYDLVLAIAGKFGDTGDLYYAEEHVYVQVVPPLPGDLNCDGSAGFNDINPFVLRLSNPIAYQTAYPGCPDANADINADGSVGFSDINPFVALLAGG